MSWFSTTRPTTALRARAAVAVVLTALVATSPYLVSAPAAGPSVIRDEMLQDTAITPTLGRGYSIATNTYQSMCLIDVVSTTPSYDFDYSFENIQSNTTKTGSMASTQTNKGKRTNAQSTKTNSSQSGYTMADEWKESQTVTDKGGASTYQHMLATVSINVYYNSVDESKTKLSPAAVKIIESKDIPGFFDACGMYYVRSISRRARIYSLITYTTQSSERDLALDSSVKTAIRSFSLTATPTSSTTATTTTASTGSEMIKGQDYISANGAFRTVFQDDGNLCVYQGVGMNDCTGTMRRYGATRAVEQGDRCYGYWSTSLNQANAYTMCRSLGTDLASVGSATENNLISGISNNDYVWLGGDDLESEGTWNWKNQTTSPTFWTGNRDGSTSTYANWSSGEPNNAGNNEDCVHMWGGGKWNDIPCTNQMRFVCEGSQAIKQWCSMTQGRGYTAKVANNDLVIYDRTGNQIWSTAKDRVGKENDTQLVIENDGNLRLYSPGKQPISETGTGGTRQNASMRPGTTTNTADIVVSQSSSVSEERDTEDKTYGKQTTKSTGSNLQISTKAVGLGKQTGTMLISYDIESYKKAIESAFKATLPDNVGKVSSIEVVPWMENTEFQSLFKLEEREVPLFDRMGFPEMDLTDPAKPVQKVKKVMAYEQKRIIQTNAEFLAEVDRAARAKLNAFYKAKMCRAQINADYMEQDDETGEYFFPEDREAIANAIEISKASYGANCNPGNVDNMTQVLGEACNGQSQCTYQIDPANIGDPAPNCQKAYEVEYRCMAPAKRGYNHIAIAKEASGKSFTIDCLSPENQPRSTSADPAAVGVALASTEVERPNVGQTTWVYNNRKPNESQLLEDIVNMLSETKLQRMWMEYDAFMYGGTGDDVDEVEEDPAQRAEMARKIMLGTLPELGYPKNIFPGAGRCVAELFLIGITAVPYRNIRACQRIEETFATVSGQKVDDYCMPRFTRVPGQASIEEAMDREAKAGDAFKREITAPNTVAPAMAGGTTALSETSAAAASAATGGTTTTP